MDVISRYHVVAMWLGATGLVLFTLATTGACTRKLDLPQPGAAEQEAEILLGSPNIIDTEPQQIDSVVRQLGECLDGKRDLVAKVWRYHKPEGRQTFVVFGKDRRVLCAKTDGISIIH